MPNSEGVFPNGQVFDREFAGRCRDGHIRMVLAKEVTAHPRMNVAANRHGSRLRFFKNLFDVSSRYEGGLLQVFDALKVWMMTLPILVEKFEFLPCSKHHAVRLKSKSGHFDNGGFSF